jgi:5'-deoxynucleotidase YfbR-like HD superfamily hydrolase
VKPLKDRYLSTFTGNKFFPFAPHPHQIDIRDIAHGLSLLCRFSGQCPYFFSVAEHSIYVANNLPDNLKLEGLLHDASEAYLADLPRPVKVGLPEYNAIEAAVEEVIAQKFDQPSYHRRFNSKIRSLALAALDAPGLF